MPQQLQGCGPECHHWCGGGCSCSLGYSGPGCAACSRGPGSGRTGGGGGRGRPHGDGEADQVPPHTVLGELQPEGLLIIYIIYMLCSETGSLLPCGVQRRKMFLSTMLINHQCIVHIIKIKYKLSILLFGSDLLCMFCT